MTSLVELEGLGGFAAPPEKRRVAWRFRGKDYEAEVFVRELSIGESEELFTVANLETSRRGRVARFIAASILFGPDGSEPVDYETSYRFRKPLGDALFELFREVNGLTDAKINGRRPFPA